MKIRFILLLISVGFAQCTSTTSPEYEILILNGELIDGTGVKRVKLDLGKAADRNLTGSRGGQQG